MPPTAEILRRLVARNGLLIVTALLGAAAGWLYAAIRSPSYEASAYVVMTPTNPSTADSTAASFAQAFGRITTQEGVLRLAVPIVGSSSEEDLRRAVRVSTSPDAPLIRITGSAGTAPLAAARANAVATALVVYGNQRSVRTRVRLDSFAEASPPPGPASPRPALDTVVGGAAGLLVGGLAIAAGAGRRAGAGRPAEAAVAGAGAGAEPEADGHYHWAVPVRFTRHDTGNSATPVPTGGAGGTAGDDPAQERADAPEGTAGGTAPAGGRAVDGDGTGNPPDLPEEDTLTVPITTGAIAGYKLGSGRRNASGPDGRTGRP
jgi:capsular polysaccharide biosynthesis protein